MTKQLFKKIVFFIITSIVFTSCESSSDDNTPSGSEESKLVANYYFKGTLDGKELNIEQKIFDPPLLDGPDMVSSDFGGSQTNDIEVLGEPGTGICYGTYASGLIYYDFQENYDKFDTAKMYFFRIPVGDCILENELIAMKDFLALKNQKYRKFSDNDKNAVALDFFPAGTANQQIYYSSRFGDNTDSFFEITSVEEIDSGTFLVEGKFSCKLYKFNDETEYKELKEGEFKITVSNNL